MPWYAAVGGSGAGGSQSGWDVDLTGADALSGGCAAVPAPAPGRLAILIVILMVGVPVGLRRRRRSGRVEP
jgi:hypothetical protein